MVASHQMEQTLAADLEKTLCTAWGWKGVKELSILTSDCVTYLAFNIVCIHLLHNGITVDVCINVCVQVMNF